MQTKLHPAQAHQVSLGTSNQSSTTAAMLPRAKVMHVRPTCKAASGAKATHKRPACNVASGAKKAEDDDREAVFMRKLEEARSVLIIRPNVDYGIRINTGINAKDYDTKIGAAMAIIAHGEVDLGEGKMASMVDMAKQMLEDDPGNCMMACMFLADVIVFRAVEDRNQIEDEKKVKNDILTNIRYMRKIYDDMCKHMEEVQDYLERGANSYIGNPNPQEDARVVTEVAKEMQKMAGKLADRFTLHHKSMDHEYIAPMTWGRR
jgi:hypothetical protein